LLKTIILVVVLFSTTHLIWAQTNDVEEVLRVWAKFESAANQLDARAIIALYADDADRIGLNGHVSKGKEEISQSYFREMEGLKQIPDLEPYSAEVSVRMISSQVALLDGISNGSTRYIFTTLFAKRDGEWKILASRPRGKLAQ